MCASPISASDAPTDPIGRLWRASRMAGPSEQLLMLAELPRASDPLQAAIIPAVARHLRARALLSLAMLDGAQAEASKGLSAWDGVAAAIGSVDPQMAVRAHAFHARLASRHVDAYRDFARRQLLELAAAARLKSESVLAEIAAACGDTRLAAESLRQISTTWRADLPVRLPGLCAIELAAACHYAAIGDAARAQEMRDRAATIAGVMSAYAEDAPEDWPPQPSQEGLLRFAFAAVRLPASLDMSREIPPA